ncbi:MAG TPA: hypothetical protein VLT61_04635 [Anaeromyxobacteraceae bacterium]|nr:hypothetical protein [Anaeromyxobacteraceae bacterium]
MISKTHLLGSLHHECTVAQHLFTKLPPDSFDYRPSATQRSTLELLQYLSVIGIAGATCMAEQDWKRFAPFGERAKAMTAEGFPAAMERQKAELTALFDALSDERLATQQAPLPAGGTQPLAVALMNGPLKWLTAYKLQLFLYAKATGATGIGTANAWRGTDPAPKPA